MKRRKLFRIKVFSVILSLFLFLQLIQTPAIAQGLTPTINISDEEPSTIQEETYYGESYVQVSSGALRSQPHGVYAIRKANSNIYVKSTSLSSLAWVFQEEFTTPPINSSNREYLFKITYRSSTGDYIIRSMANNEMFIFPSLINNAPLANKISVSGSPATDSNLSTGYTWKMTATTDGFYYIWYEAEGIKYYVCSTSTDGGGTAILTLTTNHANSGTKWQFVQYTDSSIDGVGWINHPNKLIPGESYPLQAYMYSSTIGRNGPVVFSSDDANILSIGYTTGTITANALGTTNIWISYSGAPFRWGKSTTIVSSVEGSYYFGNFSTGRLLTANSELEQWKYELSKQQNWHITYDGGGYYKIKNASTNTYLTSPVSSVSGEKIVLQGLVAENNIGRQQWDFTKQADGSYQIRARNRSTYVISTDSTSTANGIKISQRPPDYGIQTKWNLAFFNHCSGHGAQNRTIPLQRIGSGAGSANDGGIWQTAIIESVTLWKATAARPNISFTDSDSIYKIEVEQKDETWYGLCWKKINPSTGYLTECKITLNSNTLPTGTSTNDAKYRKSTAVHEIGHILFLADNPTSTTAPNTSIMNHNRNRTGVTAPQVLDTQNVIFFYKSLE